MKNFGGQTWCIKGDDRAVASGGKGGKGAAARPPPGPLMPDTTSLCKDLFS